MLGPIEVYKFLVTSGCTYLNFSCVTHLYRIVYSNFFLKWQKPVVLVTVEAILEQVISLGDAGINFLLQTPLLRKSDNKQRLNGVRG